MLKLLISALSIFLLVGCATQAREDYGEGRSFTPLPPPPTPIAISYGDLADYYETDGRKAVLARFEGKPIRLEAVTTGITGEGGWTGLDTVHGEFIEFRIQLSRNGARLAGLTVPGEPAQLHWINCVQRLQNQKDFGLYHFEESLPPPKTPVTIEGVFYLDKHTCPEIGWCRVVAISPTQDSTPSR